MDGQTTTRFMKKELGIFILLVVLCFIVSAINPNFLLAINLQNLARQIGAFGIFSILTWVVLHRSVYGLYLFATGRTPEAARYACSNTRWMITIAYVISGAVTAVSGIIFALYTNTIPPADHGNAYELYGTAAAVL